MLLDAPCSGSGTWRRQPENKWRLTPARLDELNRLQDQLLTEAASRVKPGGRLIYATCSVLPRENEDRIGRLVAKDKAISVIDAAEIWAGVQSGSFFKATPHGTGTDGFFTAILKKQA